MPASEHAVTLSAINDVGLCSFKGRHKITGSARFDH